MAEIPTTSTTLLRDLAHDSQHARWGEFVARYRPMMEAFMRERFPSLDADDVIQETLIELIRVFPVYHYSPKEKGYFHNYLTGILRHRALRMMGEEKRREKLTSDGRAACPHAAAEDRKAKCFFVPKGEIAENDYDLSINKYKMVEYVAEKFPPVSEIMAEFENAEREIATAWEELKGALE